MSCLTIRIKFLFLQSPACFSTGLDPNIDQRKRESFTTMRWQIFTFLGLVMCTVFIHLLLTTLGHASVLSPLRLPPFWLTAAATCSLSSALLAGKWSPLLSHWYEQSNYINVIKVASSIFSVLAAFYEGPTYALVDAECGMGLQLIEVAWGIIRNTLSFNSGIRDENTTEGSGTRSLLLVGCGISRILWREYEMEIRWQKAGAIQEKLYRVATQFWPYHCRIRVKVLPRAGWRKGALKKVVGRGLEQPQIFWILRWLWTPSDKLF